MASAFEPNEPSQPIYHASRLTDLNGSANITFGWLSVEARRRADEPERAS